ncbi:hypothetical protein [Polyangium sp. 15x6]|uniref:hypothetical protein n=1 Tax=Polyangium sp. 15x6 TaxID=3042687 RepID=UPI002499DD99|nr:hypothetical protein [Polyangium sp. 15x6]MDI3284638.1 hypothetical protein [Polyangium sp. 15x6]
MKLSKIAALIAVAVAPVAFGCVASVEDPAAQADEALVATAASDDPWPCLRGGDAACDAYCKSMGSQSGVCWGLLPLWICVCRPPLPSTPPSDPRA